MRKPRAIIFDDDIFTVNLLKDFFLMQGYEALSFGDPASLCAIAGMAGDACPNTKACTDVLITEIAVPGGNGLDQNARPLRAVPRPARVRGAALDAHVQARLTDGRLRLLPVLRGVLPTSRPAMD